MSIRPVLIPRSHPAQFAGMIPTAEPTDCPWGPGVDPYVVALLNQYPAANGYSTGDGLNTGSFTSPRPVPGPQCLHRQVRLTPNDCQRDFVRGNLMGDRSLGVPEFPGQQASTEQVNNSKGIAVGQVDDQQRPH